MHRSVRGSTVLAAALLAAAVVAACGGNTSEADTGAAAARGSAGETPAVRDGAFRVITTVSPLRNIVENVGGDRVVVVGLVPEGTNSHTFEPAPSAVQELAEADLVVINGLNLELPALELAEANARPGVEIVRLGEQAIDPDEYVFDFSFPQDQGNPNPHLWTAPNLAIRYAEIVRDALSRLDNEGAPYYAHNFERFRERVNEMDKLFAETIETIPEQNRKLLTYHDSFPFFGSRYGLEIIGAVQPSDFSDPSPREVAGLIEQLRDAGVPAIFGSEVFSSEVLAIIAQEAGAVQVNTLRDDDLPGDPGDANNTYVAMMVQNVQTIVTSLGGDAASLDGFPVSDTWIPFNEFRG